MDEWRKLENKKIRMSRRSDVGMGGIIGIGRTYRWKVDEQERTNLKDFRLVRRTDGRQTGTEMPELSIGPYMNQWTVLAFLCSSLVAWLCLLRTWLLVQWFSGSVVLDTVTATFLSIRRHRDWMFCTDKSRTVSRGVVSEYFGKVAELFHLGVSEYFGVPQNRRAVRFTSLWNLSNWIDRCPITG